MVRRCLTRVDRVFERVVDVLPADHVERIGVGVGEQAPDRLLDQPVALVLRRLDLQKVALGLREPPQAAERRCQVPRRVDHHRALLAREVGRLSEPVDVQQLGRIVHVVQHVVGGAREPVDVLAVERRDVLGVEQRDDLAGHVVADMLQGLDLGVLDHGRVDKALLDQARGLDRIRSGAREHVEELRGLGQDRESHVRRPLTIDERCGRALRPGHAVDTDHMRRRPLSFPE